MKAQLPKIQHYSYIQHRKQVVRQVILPVVLAGVLLAALIVLICMATFQQGGDVDRWAAISTMWIIIPVMIAGLILLAVLIGLIYLLILALGGLPYYTGIAQDYVYKARSYVVRGADMVAKPILALDGWVETIKAFFERIRQ